MCSEFFEICKKNPLNRDARWLSAFLLSNNSNYNLLEFWKIRFFKPLIEHQHKNHIVGRGKVYHITTLMVYILTNFCYANHFGSFPDLLWNFFMIWLLSNLCFLNVYIMLRQIESLFFSINSCNCTQLIEFEFEVAISQDLKEGRADLIAYFRNLS